MLAMAFTIQQSIRPLLVTWFIIGLGGCPLKQSNPAFSFLYSLTLWGVYGYVFYRTIIFFTWSLLFPSIINTSVMTVNILTTITTVIVSLSYNKKFIMCIEKLAAVDDTLYELGTPKIYRKVYAWSRRIIIGWIVFVCVTNGCDMLWWITKEETYNYAFSLPYLYNHSIHINLFMDLLFIFFLWYIGNRFDRINEHMHHLLVNEEHELRCTWKKPVIFVNRYTDNYKRVLWSAMHLHLELRRIACELNLMFSAQMSLEMMAYFIFLVALGYFVCAMIIERKNIPVSSLLNIIIWTSLFIVRLFYVNYMCENICLKSNKISRIFHQLTNTLRYADVHQEIWQFILQAMHRPLQFTGIGFCFGNTFLRKFIMASVTFVIIIMQLSSNFKFRYWERYRKIIE